MLGLESALRQKRKKPVFSATLGKVGMLPEFPPRGEAGSCFCFFGFFSLPICTALS